MRPGARWHGFTHLTDDYVMTDPNKLTLVTPGFDRETGGYLDWGVPAPVLAQFLRERGIVPEKNDLNTILFLVTPGIEVSKAGTLIAALDDFKRMFDANGYLKLFEESYAQFPGFANEIQGVYPEEGEDGRVRFFTYVIREQ